MASSSSEGNRPSGSIRPGVNDRPGGRDSSGRGRPSRNAHPGEGNRPGAGDLPTEKSLPVVLPSRRQLAKDAGCSEWVARKVLQELKNRMEHEHEKDETHRTALRWASNEA